MQHILPTLKYSCTTDVVLMIFTTDFFKYFYVSEDKAKSFASHNSQNLFITTTQPRNHYSQTSHRSRTCVLTVSYIRVQYQLADKQKIKQRKQLADNITKTE